MARAPRNLADRVRLADITSLTFYANEPTRSYRSPPVTQLECVGKPCRDFQPDAVLCVNAGGDGTDVNWKCEADLPQPLRFGRVEVSCEGWTKPGDAYVLRGSCGLKYRLVQGPQDPASGNSNRPWSKLGVNADDIFGTLFNIIWTCTLLFFAYNILSSCFRRRLQASSTTPRGGPPSSGTPYFGSPPGSDPYSSRPPPPPYSKNSPPSSTYPPGSQNQASGSGWRPGFWTGLGLGGLAAGLVSRRTGSNAQESWQTRPAARRSWWDWERPTATRPAEPQGSGFAQSGWFTNSGPNEGGRRASPRGRWDDNNGEGSSGGGSGFGSMRRSTGVGGSSVR